MLIMHEFTNYSYAMCKMSPFFDVRDKIVFNPIRLHRSMLLILGPAKCPQGAICATKKHIHITTC